MHVGIGQPPSPDTSFGPLGATGMLSPPHAVVKVVVPKWAPQSLLLVEAGAEEFLESGYLAWIEFFSHIQSVANQLFYQDGKKMGFSLSCSIS